MKDSHEVCSAAPSSFILTVRRPTRTMASLFVAVCLAGQLFAADKELKSVGLTVGDLGNPFFVQIAHGATAQARTYNPDVKFTSLSSNYDLKNQIDQMASFISSAVDLIILSAADSKGIAPAVKPLTSHASRRANTL